MKKFCSLFLCLFLFLCPFLFCNAVYYDDSFPYEETGLTGGAFLECKSDFGDVVIVVPYNYKDNYFTVGTNGNIFNASSSTITGTMFKDGLQYSIRWNGFSYPQYRLTNTSYTYTDIVISSVTDTNIVFITENSSVQNNNYYLSDYQKIIISLLFSILFFVFLGWFLLHRK